MSVTGGIDRGLSHNYVALPDEQDEIVARLRIGAGVTRNRQGNSTCSPARPGFTYALVRTAVVELAN